MRRREGSGGNSGRVGEGVTIARRWDVLVYTTARSLGGLLISLWGKPGKGPGSRQEIEMHCRSLETFYRCWKIGISVNYGLTCNWEFAMSLKTQELNYENIPVVEERRAPDSDEECQQRKRRVICARWVRQIRRERGGGRPQNWEIPPYTAWID